MVTYGTGLGALGDPTRRAIFELLADRPRAVGELAGLLPVSRPAVSQHLRVLKDAGLVVDRAVGTRRLYRLDPVGVGALRAYLDSVWDAALEAFTTAVEQEDKERTMTVSMIPIWKQTTVQASQAKAFQTFTEGMGRWWSRDYKIGKEALASAVIEPREGGRWYERGEQGGECDWGRVLVWDSPHRVVLTWQIDGTFQFDPGLVTELEVRFIPEGPSATRVELEHRGLEALGSQAESTRAIFDSPAGWAGLLELFAAAAVAS